MNKNLLAVALAATGLLGSGAADAAKISLLNLDPAGVGLNDSTPAVPVGGNPGKSVGEQRRIAYQFAMDMWGGVLESKAEIKVYASFAPLACTANQGVLGSAGANWIVWNGPNMVPNTLYPSALGDALAGFDLVADPSDPGDILSRFNGNLGQPDCLAGTNWYYGLDGNTPDRSINFLNVVMHEIGHGLGMAGFLNKTTGAFNSGIPDIYSRHAYDNVTGKRFDDPTMTDALRAQAMRTPGRTVWDGANVNAQAPLVLDKNRAALRVTAPVAAAGSFEFGVGSFGPAITPATFPSRQMVVVDDGIGATTDGCEPAFANAAAIQGKYAVIDRGSCAFTVKALNAQANGAAGVIIVNTAAEVVGMGGTDPAVTIPVILVSSTDGARIKANSPSTGGIATDPRLLYGADNSGRVRLYSPPVVAAGSTFSHFDTALQPNALMEPFDTPEVQSQFSVDLTPAAFADIGWTLNTRGARLGNCDTTVPGVKAGGLIPGGHVLAQAGVCKSIHGRNKVGYSKCVYERTRPLVSLGMMTTTQSLGVSRCAVLQP